MKQVKAMEEAGDNFGEDDMDFGDDNFNDLNFEDDEFDFGM